ncbi:hypothetical protein Tco_1301670 [Tanacetum coccineum]
MEVFINGLPRSIEGNVTASKPQTLEEAINIAQRLMDQIIKYDSMQEANDHKRKLDRIEDKKPSELILPPMDILETFPYVKDVGRATTTAASLDAAQASGNITKTQPTTIPNVPISQEISTGGCPRCQEAMGGYIAQTRSEKVPTQSYDSPLPIVNTLGSDEGSMTLQELTVLCTTLSKKVERLEADLQQTKKVYGTAYTKLIKKVKKLEKTIKSNQARRRAKIMVSYDEEDSEDSSKQGRKIDEIDQDPDITLVQHDAEIQGRHGQEMKFETEVYTAEDVSTAGAAVTTSDASISTASPLRVSTTEEISTAETLVCIRRSAAKDKGKTKMDESELEQTKTKLQQRQEKAGYEAAIRLQEQLDEE